MRIRFDDIRELDLANAVVLVDVDGTLVHDGAERIDSDVREKLKSIAQHAEVYLCSNGPAPHRFKDDMSAIGIKTLESKHKKPSRKVIGALPVEGKRIVVIGDKFLTDGLLAQSLEAEFVHVERKYHPNDRFTVRAIYLFDDLCSALEPYITLIRPQQWVKNLLVFAPLFFASDFFDVEKLWASVTVFIAFCAVASAAYVFNDLFDVAQDREHPRKRFRPIASGRIGSLNASILLGLLVLVGIFALSYVPASIPALVVYVLLNILYTFSLKHVVLLDLVLIGVFYVLRVIAGGEAAGILVSSWILLCTFFGALVLAVGKRSAEFSHQARRTVLSRYTKEALAALLTLFAVITTLCYAVWSVVASPVSHTVYSTIFVAAAFTRIQKQFAVAPEGFEYPERMVFADQWVLAAFCGWAICMGVIFYAL